MYPWIVGPFVASGALLGIEKHMTPVGVLAALATRVVRDHGIALVTLLLGAMLALGIMIASRLGNPDESATERPFEPPPLPPAT